MTDLPALPPGYQLTGTGPPPNPDLLAPLLGNGVAVTSGYRTPADIERLRSQGYHPAPNSHHLDGDAVDLVPGKSGMTMRQLQAKAQAIASGWSNGRVIPEGDHIHLQIPGWGMAPGTPGTPNSVLPPLPGGYQLFERGTLAATKSTGEPAQPPPPAGYVGYEN